MGENLLASRDASGEPTTVDDRAQQIREKMRAMYPRLPDKIMDRAINYALKNNHSVLRTATTMPLHVKVKTILRSHIRHSMTNYDKLCKQYTRALSRNAGALSVHKQHIDVRKRASGDVEPKVIKILKGWS
jgi:hypothetical protein